MFVILEVSKQWIFFIFPSSLYSNIRSWILLLFINSLSEPHVSEHDDPSIGRKVTVGDDVGPDDENDDDDDNDGGDDVATMGDDVVETIVGGKERMGVRNGLVDDNENDNDDENENERESDDDGGDDVATMGDDTVETIVGGKERMGVRNKLGRSVGKAVVLLDAWVGIVLWLLFNLTLSSVGNE